MVYNALAYGYLKSSGEGLVRFLHVLNVLPDLMYLTTLLTGCLCLLCPLATATLPFHVICGLFSVPPFVTPFPLYSFLNMLNGSIVKLCFLWLPLDTSFPPACFLITDTLLNIFFICAIHACSQTGYFSFAMESNRTKNYRWGPFSRFLKASKALGLSIEDPFVFIFHPDAVSIDQPLSILKHVLRNSYRQLLLQRSLQSLHEQVWRRVTLSR